MKEPPVAVITGASSGLGLALTRTAIRRGYRVYMIARDEKKLKSASEQFVQAQQDLAPDDPAALTCETRVADVTDSESIREGLQNIPRIDVLINCVGRSDRGEFLKTDPAALEHMFKVNVLSIRHTTAAALPALEAARGVVVNIGSLAGKVAPRFLGGYAATKFAVSGVSQQMRLELAERGIHVLLVCPGPIQRSDAGTRYNEVVEKSDLPAAAAAPGGGAKLSGLDPLQLAERIFNAAERRQPELICPWKVKLLIAIGALFPKLADRVLRNKTA